MKKHHFATDVAKALTVLALGSAAFAQDVATPPAQGYKDSLLTNYVSNFVPPVPLITLTNPGSNAVSGSGFNIFQQTPADLCANIYNFRADGSFINCCSCKVPANGILQLTGSQLFPSGAAITSVTGAMVKVLQTVVPPPSALSPNTPGICSPVPLPQGNSSLGSPGGLASGMRGTAYHQLGTTESRFEPVPLSPAEITKLENTCKASAARCNCANPIGD